MKIENLHKLMPARLAIALLLPFCIFILLPSGCHSGDDSGEDQSKKSVRIGQTSPEWAGTYRGILPCSDCAGIKVQISLYENDRFHIKRQYMGKIESILNLKGQFEWKSNNKIHLRSYSLDESFQNYELQENHLLKLDEEGKKIGGDLASHYKLDKVEPNEITGKTWTLERLQASEVELGNFKDPKPHIFFGSSSNLVKGFAGCNGFRADYILTASSNEIEISNMLITDKECTHSDLEKSYILSLENAQSYRSQIDTLRLFDEFGKESLRFAFSFFDQ